MDAPVQQTANDYRLLIAPVSERAVARRGESVLAASDAARIMYETRLPATVYYPRGDVAARLISNAAHRTFCPFKGTASYFDVEVGGERLEAAAWSYERALPEAAGVEGMIAFMPAAVTALTLDGAPVPEARDGNIAGPTVDWLLRAAPFKPSPEDLTRAFAERLCQDGVAVSRLSVLVWSLHPLIAGRNYVWTREDGAVRTWAASYDMLDEPEFAGSPLEHVASGLGGVRQRLDVAEAEFSFPIMADLRAKGATDYVAMPLHFSSGRINVMTMASDHPKGFTTRNLGLVFECSFMLGRLYETFTLRDNFTALLDTYLGHHTGARVLSGEIRRGDGDAIDAAILFCDLRGSTALEARLPREAYLGLLNGFFDITAEGVAEHGGEVLKFIGDAALAIFPAGDDPAAACRQAVAAARAIVARVQGAAGENGRERLDCAIGVAFGNVTYGNIGSQSRLDFTVIGSAANLAARLCDYGKHQGRRIVVSDTIAPHAAGAISPLGDVALHGVPDPVAAFAAD